MQQRWLVSAPLRRLTSYSTRRNVSDQKLFEPNDHVILRNVKNKKWIQRGPLTPGRRVETNAGVVKHDHIIGRRDRDVVSSVTGDGKELARWRLHEVRLDEYVVNTRRLVTPIYPQDASVIVNLFDFHPQMRRVESRREDKIASRVHDSFFSQAVNAVTSLFGGRRHEKVAESYHEDIDNIKPSIEILEAGTGHGTLTLHLSRAIHAANTLPPAKSSSQNEAERDGALKRWKLSRNAVIHSIDISSAFSKHATGIVKGFRQGQYADNVDFHVGHVQDWVKAALTRRENEPFLTHAFLDLPSSERQLAVVSSALQVGGTLIVFNPSISQVMESLRKVKEEKLPLILDTVRELGVNGGSGGREWDVRAVIPRAFAKKKAPTTDEAHKATGSDQDLVNEEESVSEDESTTDVDEEATNKTSDWRMICRPKVGDRIAGGGFITVFKKKAIDE